MSDTANFPDPNPDNPIHYIATLGWGIVGTCVFTICGILFAFQIIRYRAWWFWTILFLCIGEVVGYAFRIYLSYHPYSANDLYPPFVIEYVLLIISPLAMQAALYMAMTRIVRYICPGASPIPSEWLGVIFVTSDIATFLIQVIGGVMTISDDIDTELTGIKLLQAGLGLALASFAIFVFVLLCFEICLKTDYRFRYNSDSKIRGLVVSKADETNLSYDKPKSRICFVPTKKVYIIDTPPASNNYKFFLACFSFSSLMLLTRNCFRIAEFSDGYSGYLAVHQAYFYGLDLLPIALGSIALIIGSPCRYLPRWQKVARQDIQLNDLTAINDL